MDRRSLPRTAALRGFLGVKNMKTVIGMDLGGTKLLLGEVDESGRILREMSVSSGPLTQEEAMTRMQSALGDFLSGPRYGEPYAVGIGLVGRVDSGSGIWYEIDRSRAKGLPLAAQITDRCGLPCFIDNDVRSAARAELLFGEGRRSRDFIYLNVGTGIAAGIVTEGKLLRGGHCNAGEVGHTSSGLSLGITCICGRRDCAEAVASGLGLDSCARLLLPDYPDSALKLPENGRVSAREIFRLSDRDALCARLTDMAAAALAELIMNLVRFSDPDCVVLGGGVVADGFLLQLVQEKLEIHTMRFVSGGVRLTELDGRRIGLLGAACNAMEGMRGTL